MANIGSMPLEQFAIMESVPVGAMVVRVALRNFLERPANMLLSKFGNAPRSTASPAKSWSSAPNPPKGKKFQPRMHTDKRGR